MAFDFAAQWFGAGYRQVPVDLPFTVSVWVQPDDHSSASYQVICGQADNWVNTGGWCLFSTSGNAQNGTKHYDEGASPGSPDVSPLTNGGGLALTEWTPQAAVGNPNNRGADH